MGRRAPRSFLAQQADFKRLWATLSDWHELSSGHYRIDRVADFWPSTDRWFFLDGSASGHGVEDLIKHLKPIHDEWENELAPNPTKLPDVGVWRHEGGYWGRR